jgi:hypothetical protein
MIGDSIKVALQNRKHFRLRLGTLFDVLLVADRDEIGWLNEHADVSRALNPDASLLHRVMHRRLTVDLGFDGKVLPVFLPRSDPRRVERQRLLETELDGTRGLPGTERNDIADYVRGKKYFSEIGVVVQEWCGKLFFPNYHGSGELYDAAKLLATWPSELPWQAWFARLSGRLGNAKVAISTAAHGDLYCVHATSIGMENVARSVRKLRMTALDPRKKELSPDQAVRECLAAPPAVLRGCSRSIEAPFLERPLTERTLLVFLVAQSFARTGDLDDAFLAESWSRCPAHEVVPEMLRAVWYAAQEEPKQEPIKAKVNGWGTLFQRAVSSLEGRT